MLPCTFYFILSVFLCYDLRRVFHICLYSFGQFSHLCVIDFYLLIRCIAVESVCVVFSVLKMFFAMLLALLRIFSAEVVRRDEHLLD